eukprot:gene5321-6139_t
MPPALLGGSLPVTGGACGSSRWFNWWRGDPPPAAFRAAAAAAVRGVPLRSPAGGEYFRDVFEPEGKPWCGLRYVFSALDAAAERLRVRRSGAAALFGDAVLSDERI